MANAGTIHPSEKDQIGRRLALLALTKTYGLKGLIAESPRFESVRFEGGKAILAMPSVTNKGVSKIASTLTLGAGVVTTRAHAHWFVTEYGAVNLYGKSLQERARLIISVAHPDHQEELDKAAFERYGAHHTYIKATTQTK